MTVIYKYLDCGDLHFGFARVRCEECGHEYLLAFLIFNYFLTKGKKAFTYPFFQS